MNRIRSSIVLILCVTLVFGSAVYASEPAAEKVQAEDASALLAESAPGQTTSVKETDPSGADEELPQATGEEPQGDDNPKDDGQTGGTTEETPGPDGPER